VILIPSLNPRTIQEVPSQGRNRRGVNPAYLYSVDTPPIRCSEDAQTFPNFSISHPFVVFGDHAVGVLPASFLLLSQPNEFRLGVFAATVFDVFFRFTFPPAPLELSFFCRLELFSFLLPFSPWLLTIRNLRIFLAVRTFVSFVRIFALRFPSFSAVFDSTRPRVSCV